ncbi:hypothetical protein AAG570_002555 [Ranatra chinensis]|uniref:Hemocyanin N-terminal domain-containing protein n=1 Tax=Ranatra chinensis TaxID=642074 RepID=A0ABD0Y7W8_9HEMI
MAFHQIAADGEFLGRQKSVLDLIVGIGHEHWYKSQYENFDIKSNIQQYTDQNVVNEFWREYDYGWMSKEQEFTLRDPKILRQTIKLFDLFYYAKNFDTFYKPQSMNYFLWVKEQKKLI